MARPPHISLSWFKQLSRFVNSKRRSFAAARLKKDINHLEQERAKEKSALLGQRRFYEKLLRRRTSPEIKEVKEIKSIPTPIVSPIIPKPISQFTPTPQAMPTPSPIPSTKDIRTEPVALKPKLELQTETKTSGGFTKLFKKASLLFSGTSLAQKLAEERQEEAVAQVKNEVEQRFWQPYNSVKANLIKDQGVLFFNWQQRILTLSLALVLCTLAIGLVYVGLLIWQKEKLRDNEATLKNFDAINIEIAKSENDTKEIVEFNHKLDLVSFILSNHIYWTNFFAFLEADTLKDVYFDNFSGDLTGHYVIPATARNLDAVSLQLEVMKTNKLIKTIQYSGGQTVTGVAGQPDKMKFNLEMSLDPKIFLK